MFSVIKTKKIWFSLSGVLFVLSILAVAVWHLKLGIDFTGGSLMELHTPAHIEAVQLSNAADTVLKDKSQVQPIGGDGYIVRTPFIDEPKHQAILEAIKKIPGIGEVREERFETIGPTVSAELQSKAVWSILVVLIAIILYVAWAFREVSHPIQSWKFGIVAVIALLHDVFIPVGVFAVLGKFLGYEVDTLFVTAVLTILGFSVHDTIVTFDRVREHIKRTPKAVFNELVDTSVRETLRRSINTSMTVLLVLLPVYFFGGETIKQFLLVLILGVIVGTYSSVCIACPLLSVWNDLAHNRS